MQGELEKLTGMVRAINEAWLDDRIEDLQEFFHPEAVVFHSQNNTPMKGRNQIIKSYHDFKKRARIHHFWEGDINISLFDKTATAVYPFDVSYEMDEKTFSEKGTEIMVFQKNGENWQVLWRTIMELR